MLLKAVFSASIHRLSSPSFCAAGMAVGAWALSISAICQVQPKVDFRRDVQPLFNEYCVECHGPSQQMHGFRLDRRSDAMRGGTLPMITPGNSESSRLYLKLTGNQYGPQMPPTGPLSPEQIRIIKTWIDEGAQWPDDVSGETPPPPPDPKAVKIMTALRNGDKPAFEKLVREDPKVGNLRGPGGTTPLMQAVVYGDLECVRLLLENGADPNLSNDAGATALMWAADDLEKTQLLLDHGANMNARSAYGVTPLLNATGQLTDEEVARRLLRDGANPSARSPLLVGFVTPLSEAALAGDESLLRMLIERGADVNSAGINALLSAYRARCAECFETLMKHSDPKTLTGAALRIAPLLRDGNAVKELLEIGVDANARDPKGNTLLMLAASSDLFPVEGIERLIHAGADLNARNSDGRTALDFAKLNGSTPVVDLLVKCGAKESRSSVNPAPQPQPAATAWMALERSIPLLQNADVGFMQTSGCVSCHNNSLTAMTVAIARRSGLKVNEEISRSQIRKIGAYIESRRERMLQGVGIPGEQDTISYILLGLAAENYPPDPATDALARFLRSRQYPDGHWPVFTRRPPLESSDIEVTALSLRSLQVYGIRSQHAGYEIAIRRARDWLMKAQPATTEDRAFQLLGLQWAGVKSNNRIIRIAARNLLAQQRQDGGWAQLPTLSSDAYATGQALVALRQAGAIPATAPSFKKGIAFLLKRQFEDGSWYVRSRAIPLQPYFDSGFPHGRDQFISAAATNWAAMALALSLEQGNAGPFHNRHTKPESSHRVQGTR